MIYPHYDKVFVNQGYQDYFNGLELTDNPYIEGGLCYEDWHTGWEQAENSWITSIVDNFWQN